MTVSPAGRVQRIDNLLKRSRRMFIRRNRSVALTLQEVLECVFRLNRVAKYDVVGNALRNFHRRKYSSSSKGKGKGAASTPAKPQIMLFDLSADIGEATNLATADFSTGQGSITAGSYLDTHTQNDVSEAITGSESSRP